MRRKLLATVGMVAGAVAVLASNTAVRAGLAIGSGGHTVRTSAAGHQLARRPAGGRTGGSTTSLPPGAVTEEGPVVDTRFGPVQVRVSFANGRITESQAVQTPNDRRRSVMINQYATPILRQETLSAQSANIDLVSGATVTSEAYTQSLQAAIDKAPR